ncbi:hypothetical protein PG996_014062 [Apiospora saccharicola]|uniref:Membrane-associated protein n=1 Tax=Apiospora saccharicola TaxID=335842 RepID=A0ABR1TH91_9PEZI
MNKFLALFLVLCTTIATMAMGERTPWVPRETGLVLPVAAAAPAPVPAHDLAAAAPVAAVALVSAAPVHAPAPAATTTNSWVNDQTCGWYSGTSSSAFVCGPEWHCSTNSEHIVGCYSGTYSPMFTACLDLAAWSANSCSTQTGTKVGCCSHDTAPACGLYLWTGEPTRSMYRCMTATTVVTMLDEPQFVLDSRTRTSTSSSASAASPSITNSSNDDDDADDEAEEKNTITVVGITIGTILGFFFILGMARLAASFRWRCHGGDGGAGAGAGGEVRGGESEIELVDLPQQQQQHQQQEQEQQQQQQQGRQV